jgi:coenzyme F420-dependent glucose-6-phosphate dehydrogenase
MQIGYKLCSEERYPLGLVDDARRAEDAGFDFAAISDHYHPWTDTQGESPFVWSSIGAIATATERLTIGTAVTCPTVRQHPALVAQAAATCACLLPGRFFLGVGTGERLNEHILGDAWPSASIRREMLTEAVDLLRELWSGELTTFDGQYYTVDTARLYTLPTEAIPLYVAASGTEAAALAAEIGDGLIVAGDSRDALRTFIDEGGEGPRLAEMLVNVEDNEDRALATVHERWPNPVIPGELNTELPLPRHFEQAASVTEPADLRGKVLTGTNVDTYLSQISELSSAGYTHVFLHQVGTDQDAFFRFASERLLPAIRSTNEAA